jgi:hypothetical protein
MTSLGILTLFHTLVSVVQIVLGIALVLAFLGHKPTGPLTRWFLIATAVTLVSGFVFPFNGVTPAIVVGILNAAILIVTWFAWQRAGTARLWNTVYALGFLALLFFDCLVLIVQAFQKVPFLHALAPLGNEPAVLVSQTVLLIATVLVGFFLYRGTKHAL